MTVMLALSCIAAWLALAPIAAGTRPGTRLPPDRLWHQPGRRARRAARNVAHLLGGSGARRRDAAARPAVARRAFPLDALSAFFLAVVNLGAAAASLFASAMAGTRRRPTACCRSIPAFLAGMNLVVLADDAFTFLVSWEFMSLSSWALVMAHHRERDNARAGYVYLVMASFGTLALLLAFGLLAGPDGGYAFAAMRAAHPSPTIAALVLLLVLIGAGSKAGLVPLHVWLPLAHPAAPSHVSALMSGVMTKVAVYGFVRVVFDLLGPPQWWWSVPVLMLGGATAVMGLLSAVLQGDLKKLLAYSTIENIGIVFVGLGLALAFKANAMPAAAALAMTAALFHVLNHSIFKSLLFFGAGAVLTATGERDMEHLGGLIHRMPLTAFTFLVGCMAISALPPLNGFVSEWLTFQAILLSPRPAAMGPEVPGARGRRDARVVGGARRGLLRQGVRRDLPRPAAHDRGGRRAGGRPLVARGHVHFRRPVSPHRNHPRPGHRRARAGRERAGGRAHAGAVRRRRGCRSCRSPRAAAPIMGSWSSSSSPCRRSPRWRSSTALPRARCAAARPGTAAFRIRARPRNIPPAASPSRSAAYSARCSTRASMSRCRRRATPRPARLTIRLRDLVWEMLYAPVATAIWFATEKLNHLQFLTIRKYLSLVFVALVALLLGVSLWP